MRTAEMKTSTWSIKNLKTFMDHEGNPKGAYTCTLYRDGKKIARVLEDGWGGGLQFHDMSKEESELLDAYCSTLPKEPWGFDISERNDLDPEGMAVNADMFVAELVGKYEEDQYYKRQCRKNTLAILKHHKTGEFLKFNRPYSERIVTYINDKYGNDLVEIINERYI